MQRCFEKKLFWLFFKNFPRKRLKLSIIFTTSSQVFFWALSEFWKKKKNRKALLLNTHKVMIRKIEYPFLHGRAVFFQYCVGRWWNEISFFSKVPLSSAYIYLFCWKLDKERPFHEFWNISLNINISFKYVFWNDSLL